MSPHQVTLQDLPIAHVNSASPIPLYYQVEANLRAILKSDVVSSGDLLPTEHDLAEAFGVGRHTIRTALGRLVSDGLIVRKAGHGTVVRGDDTRRQFSLGRSFTRQMEALGMQPRTQVLQQEARTVQPTDPRALADCAGAPCLVLTRLRYGNDEPIGLQRSFILTTRCPTLADHDLAAQSLYAVLSHDFQLVITEITHTVTATAADRRLAELLRVEPRAALLVVNTTAFLEDRELIEFSVSYYRADKYEYTTTMVSP